MKVAIIIGTRPEIIKMSPLIRTCAQKGLDFFVLHTGQHYDYELDGKIFKDLSLPKPKFNLNVGGKPYRVQKGIMIREMAIIFEREGVDVVIVQGDTNSVMAGTLAAIKTKCRVAHHEAGLRSHDLGMLEEINRIITDNVADYLFAPTKTAMKNLEEEGLKRHSFLTGNTVTDAVLQNSIIAQKRSKILNKLKLKKSKYILATAHRAENVDDCVKLKNILIGLEMVSKKLNLLVVLPLHPRTKFNIEKFGLPKPKTIKFIKPLGYLDFLNLEASAKLIITDSGGIQEEASILKIPCVTIRENTERPETIKAGINLLAGTDPQKILACSERIIKNKKKWGNLYGNGDAAEKIMDHILRLEAEYGNLY